MRLRGHGARLLSGEGVRRDQNLRTARAKTLRPAGDPSYAGLSPIRREARARTSERLGLAIEIGGSSRRAVARTLDVAERRVRDWCDPDDPCSMSIGDLEVLRTRHRAVWEEYDRMTRIEDDGNAPGLTQAEHDRLLLAAMAEAANAADPEERDRALRKLIARAAEARRDLEAGGTET